MYQDHAIIKPIKAAFFIPLVFFCVCRHQTIVKKFNGRFSWKKPRGCLNQTLDLLMTCQLDHHHGTNFCICWNSTYMSMTKDLEREREREREIERKRCRRKTCHSRQDNSALFITCTVFQWITYQSVWLSKILNNNHDKETVLKRLVS